MNPAPSDRIFVWHAVLPVPDPVFADITTLTADFLFELDSVLARYDVVALRDLVSGDRASRRPRAALTFDDALECQMRHALPVLEDRRLPYTFCVPTESVNSGRPTWNTWLRQWLLDPALRSIDLEWLSIDLSAPGVDRHLVAREVQDILLSMAEPEWQRAMDTLTRQCAAVPGVHGPSEATRPMSWAQIRLLDPTLCEPASHSRLHRPGTRGDSPASLAEDARASRAEIEGHLGRPCLVYCFPFGLFTPDSIAAVAGAGYTTLLTTCTVPVGAMSAGLQGRFAGRAARESYPDPGSDR